MTRLSSGSSKAQCRCVFHDVWPAVGTCLRNILRIIASSVIRLDVHCVIYFLFGTRLAQFSPRQPRINVFVSLGLVSLRRNIPTCASHHSRWSARESTDELLFCEELLVATVLEGR